MLPNIATLIGEIKSARRSVEDRDQRTVERVDEIERSLASGPSVISSGVTAA